MRIVHCVPSLHPGHGGPSRTVVGLTDALARCEGVAVELLSQGARGAPVVSSGEGRVLRRLGNPKFASGLALGLPLRQLLGCLSRSGTTKIDVIHSHAVWHPANHWAARAARAAGVPLILHPRGMLEPWALGQKTWKKRIALALFQRADLEAAAALVATSEMEYENLRQLGLRRPVAVIPNGVGLPAGAVRRASMGNRDVQALPGPRAFPRERQALFLSRVHPKKGLIELVRAWAQVAPIGWRLRIAGPDEDGHWHKVERVVTQLGLSDVVEYCGPVEGERKAALYREADLFVLPTFSENFGLVVAEALASGLPVITTRGAPWADLQTYGCGWWIEPGVEPLAIALRAAVALDDAARAEMGARGQAYARRYDWAAIAQETLAVYRWVLGQGDRPACVHLD